MSRHRFSFSMLVCCLFAGCSLDESSQKHASMTYGQAAEQAVVVAPEAPRSLWPADAPPIHATSAILIDARTGRTIFQKNADEPRQVASTQKLVTALIVAEQDPLDTPVRVSRGDTTVEPTKVGIRAGESYPRRQLLKAMLVHSANDCASALARCHAGTLADFAGEMNRLAARCGAACTHFVNPHGLPAAQHSTARDMARIAFRAYRNPDLRDAVALRSYCFRYANGRLCNLEPTNKLLLRDPYCNGMKTGFTESAGKCLITSYSKGGRDYILVQLGSHARYIFDDAERMMQWAQTH
jgi:D-alanyl-D-alanine carboxypeptidase (penicillin-binding protein 5/6)